MSIIQKETSVVKYVLDTFMIKKLIAADLGVGLDKVRVDVKVGMVHSDPLERDQPHPAFQGVEVTVTT